MLHARDLFSIGISSEIEENGATILEAGLEGSSDARKRGPWGQHPHSLSSSATTKKALRAFFFFFFFFRNRRQQSSLSSNHLALSYRNLCVAIYSYSPWGLASISRSAPGAGDSRWSQQQGSRRRSTGCNARRSRSRRRRRNRRRRR